MPTTRTAECLRGLIGGRVHLPGDAGYDAARVAWNLAIDQRPAAVATPVDAHEVGTVVRMAAECGLRVAAQNSGHAAAALTDRSLDETVLLRTGGMNLVVADPRSDARTPVAAC